jgi:SPP1 gp7 family putative phage head morphogenesis protein
MWNRLASASLKIAPEATIMANDLFTPEEAFSLSNPRAVAYLMEHGAELIAGIDETTRAAIHDILVQAMQEGWSYDTTAKAIREQFPEFAVGTPYKHVRSRAHLVAIDESANAYGEAELQQGLEMQGRGIHMEKRWLTAGDERVCADCIANGEAGWIPIDRPFPSGHMRYPAHPGCRCCILQQRAKAGD